MYFERFDICQAWYMYLSLTHGGQWCPKYARLCRLTEYFKPGALNDGAMSDNAKEILHNLMANQ